MSSTYADVAHEKRNQALADLRAVLDRAADERRDVTPEEKEAMDRAEADVQRFGALADQAVRADELARMAAEFRGPEPRAEAAEPERRITETDLFLRGFRAAAAGGFFAYGMDDYGNVPPEYRALQSLGGSAVDESFSTQLTVYLRQESPMFGAPITILTTPRGEPFTWPRLTADAAMGGTVTAEAAGILEADPTLSSVTFGAFKYGVTNLWSAELDEDNVIGLEAVLARSTARELASDAGAHLTTGTGTVQPNGIAVAATAGHTATGTASGQAGDTFISPTDLLNLFSSVVPGYRNRTSSAWMVSSTAAAKMRIAKDSTGQFMWQPSLVIGQPDAFYGRPVIENPAMVAVASATKSVLFGDMSAYYTRVVGAPRVEFSRDYKFSTDQLALRTIIRVDGNLIDVAAIKSLVSANT